MRKMLAVLIPEDLLKRYKHICIEMNLSKPKQTEAILRHFVEVQEDNIAKLKEAEERNKK
jgi:hypothetical protein